MTVAPPSRVPDAPTLRRSGRRPVRRSGRALPEAGRLTQPLLPLALALGTAAAALALAVSQADPTEQAEGRMLAMLAAGVMACAAFAAQLGGGKWLAGPATGSLLTLACLWLLHQGPQRGGSVVLVLAVTMAAALARSWPRIGVGAWGACLGWSTSLAVAVQLLVRPDLLLPARLGAGGALGRLWVEGIALPALFGVGLGLLAAGLGRLSLLAGVAILLAGPGVDVPRLTILGPALILALGAVWLWGRSGFEARWPVAERVETLAARGLLLVGAAAVVAASYPWLRPAPWTTLAELVPPARVAAVVHGRGVVVLDADASAWRRELPEPVAASALVLDTSLVHGLGATGRVVATVSAWDPAGELVAEWPLVGGDGTAEWAAARADVRSLEGFRAPEAWSRYVPPGGGFFANRYRAHLPLEGGALEDRAREDDRKIATVGVRLESPEDSPRVRAWELHLVRVELRR